LIKFTKVKILWNNLFRFSEPEKVLSAVFKSSFINFFARIFGYLKNFIIAILLGFSYQTDGFFMAISLIGIFLIFVDVFDSIGVPNLVKAKLRSQEDFNRLSGLLFTFTTILAFLGSILAFTFIPLILKIPIGFKENAISYTKVSYVFLIPYLFFSFYFHHFGAILRSQRLFTPYFIGEFLCSFFSFLFILIGLYLYRDYKVLPISLSLAQALATFYMFYVGREHIKFNFFLDNDTKLILKQFFYLIGVYGVFHLYLLVDKAFASLLGEKNVSALHYGLMLAMAPKNIVKFEHIAITSLSEVKGSLEKLNFYIKRLMLLGLIFSLLLFIFSELFVALFFGHGAFTKIDISLTSKATRFYALSISFAFLWPVFYRVFQIKNRLKPIFFVAIGGVIANFIANYIFVIVLSLDIAGVCFGTFFAYGILCSLSYYFLKKGS